MAQRVCEIIPMEVSDRRAVVIVRHPSKKKLNAGAYEHLAARDRNRFRTRFTKWVSGAPMSASQFAIFGGEYRGCCRFRSDDYRLYGFLVSGRNRRVQVCVLAVLAEKREQKTDYALLDRVVALRDDKAFQDAMTDYLGCGYDET